jgi:hypothetical protein
MGSEVRRAASVCRIRRSAAADRSQETADVILVADHREGGHAVVDQGVEVVVLVADG